jgi:hypothetical protein
MSNPITVPERLSFRGSTRALKRPRFPITLKDGSNPTKPRCMVDSLVHELAHTCGWNHVGGKGVPGDDGFMHGCP